MSAVVAAALPAPAMFEDEIVYEDVYIPPQFEELPINSEGDGIKLVNRDFCMVFNVHLIVSTDIFAYKYILN